MWRISLHFNSQWGTIFIQSIYALDLSRKRIRVWKIPSWQWNVSKLKTAIFLVTKAWIKLNALAKSPAPITNALGYVVLRRLSEKVPSKFTITRAEAHAIEVTNATFLWRMACSGAYSALSLRLDHASGTGVCLRIACVARVAQADAHETDTFGAQRKGATSATSGHMRQRGGKWSP